MTCQFLNMGCILSFRILGTNMAPWLFIWICLFNSKFQFLTKYSCPPFCFTQTIGIHRMMLVKKLISLIVFLWSCAYPCLLWTMNLSIFSARWTFSTSYRIKNTDAITASAAAFPELWVCAFSQLGEHAVSAIGLRIYIITASGGAFREL